MATRNIWKVNDTTRFRPMPIEMSKVEENSNLFEELEKMSEAEDVKLQKETEEHSRKVRERGNIYFLTKRNSKEIGMKPTASITKLLSEKNKTRKQIKKCKAIYEEVRLLEDRYQEHLKKKPNEKIFLNMNHEDSKSTGYWVPVHTSTGIEYMELANGPPILRKTDLLSDHILFDNNIEQKNLVQNVESTSEVNNGCHDTVKGDIDTQPLVCSSEVTPLVTDCLSGTENLENIPKDDSKSKEYKLPPNATSSSVSEISSDVNGSNNSTNENETMSNLPRSSEMDNLEKVPHLDYHNPPLINRISRPPPELPFFSTVVNQEAVCSSVHMDRSTVGVGFSSNTRRTQHINVQHQNIRIKTRQLENVPIYNLGKFGELVGGFTTQEISSELILSQSFSQLEIPKSEVTGQEQTSDLSNEIIVVSDSDDNDVTSLQTEPVIGSYQPVVEDITPPKSPYGGKTAKDISMDLAGDNENIKKTIELNPGCTFLGFFPVPRPEDNKSSDRAPPQSLVSNNSAETYTDPMVDDNISQKKNKLPMQTADQNTLLTVDKENMQVVSPKRALFTTLNERSELDQSTASIKSDSDSCTPPKGTRIPLKTFPSP